MLSRLPPVAVAIALLLATPALASAEIADHGEPQRPHARKKMPGRQIGKASLYGNFQGKRTASGEHYDHGALTAAHRTLPFDSRVRVTNLANGRSVTVRINDRGPHRKDRIIDLSRSAAEKIGMRRQGIATVLVEKLPPEHPAKPKPPLPPLLAHDPDSHPSD